MEEWWASIDPLQAREVPMLAFCELMVQKDVVTKAFEVTSMIKSTIGEKVTGTITYSQFQRIFGKAFLRGGMMNIYYYLRKIQDRDLGDANMISGETVIGSGIENGLLNVLKYQRSLVIGGLRSKP